MICFLSIAGQISFWCFIPINILRAFVKHNPKMRVIKMFYLQDFHANLTCTHVITVNLKLCFSVNRVLVSSDTLSSHRVSISFNLFTLSSVAFWPQITNDLWFTSPTFFSFLHNTGNQNNTKKNQSLFRIGQHHSYDNDLYK